MNVIKISSVYFVAACSLVLGGCGEDPASTGAAPPATGGQVSLDAGAAAPAAAAPVTAQAPDAAAAQASLPPDPAAEEAALKVRIAAGEEGTTPDPVEDRNLGPLQMASDSFYNRFQRAPSSLEEMVRAGQLTAIPRAPAGKKYSVDATTGEVKLVSAP